jgi:hypothetical protein
MAKRKKRFDIDRFVVTIEAHYKGWNPPIITFIATRGATPFEVLVSTLLSLRTKDEVTAGAAKRLFAKANTPEQILALGEAALAKLIYPVGFYPHQGQAADGDQPDRSGRACREGSRQYRGAAHAARGGPQDRQSGPGGGL